MRLRIERLLAISMTACLLTVMGGMAPRMVAHAGHHAHHKATTHTTVVCAWACAAGEVLESQAAPLTPSSVPVASHVMQAPGEPSLPEPVCSLIRGPPLFPPTQSLFIR